MEVRLHGLAVETFLEVQVWTRGVAGVADEADQASLVDGLADPDVDALEVGVERRLAVAVVDDDVPAVAAGAVGHRGRHHAGGGRHDGVADVVGTVPVDRVGARAVARRGWCPSTTRRTGTASRTPSAAPPPPARPWRGSRRPRRAAVAGRRRVSLMRDAPWAGFRGQNVPVGSAPEFVTRATRVTAALNRNHASACLSRNYNVVVLLEAFPRIRSVERSRAQSRIRIRPSWATVATRVPSSVKTRASARPRAPCGRGRPLVVEPPLVGAERPVEPDRVVERGRLEPGVADRDAVAARGWHRAASCRWRR